MNQEIIRLDLNGVNCYLGKEGDNFVLIDTGGHLAMDKEFNNRRAALDTELEKNGCRPGNLNLVLLTHGDCDHSGNAAYIRSKYGAKAAMHPGDIELVRNLSPELAMKSFHFKSPAIKVVFMVMKKLIKKVNIKIINAFERFEPDILVKEGDSLAEYGFSAKIVHIPGHTDGSIGVLSDSGCFICGDALSNMKKPAPAGNAYDFKALATSIKRIKSMNIRMVYPGHGQPFEFDLL